MKLIKTLAVGAAITMAGAGSVQAGTLDDVKAAGHLKCGISTGVPGFAFTNDAGEWQGFDPSVCQAARRLEKHDSLRWPRAKSICSRVTQPGLSVATST